MRNVLSLLIGLCLIAGLNYKIWSNEKVLLNGETVLIELAPVDPRSLMQGDYMRLAFALERKIKKQQTKDIPKSGRIIIENNENGTAEFIGFYNGQPLSETQKTMRYTKSNNWSRPIALQPRSFFFQEGHRPLYERAKYGVFKYQDQHTYLLQALADENKTIIKGSKPEKADKKEIKNSISD